MYISKQPFHKFKQPFRKSKQTFHKSKQTFRKILGKAHMRRRFFVAVGIRKSPNPIDIITGSGRRGITQAY